jgi:hypothetical protein
MRTKKMELWNIGIMVLNQKKHFDATQYSIVPPFTLLESPGIYSSDDIINRVSSLLRAG